MDDIRNPKLFKALSIACKRGLPTGLAGGKVQVVNRGQPAIGNYRQDPLGKTGQLRQDIISHGESYKVCCPYCGDQRFRLWINHLWGEYDPVLKKQNWHLIKCFNEDCTKRSDFREKFTACIDAVLTRTASGSKDASIQIATQPAEAITQIELPGQTVNIATLDASHPAAVFLKGRGHNYKRLGREFDVQWCEYSDLPQARHRIVVPIRRNGTLVGWQARYVSSTGSGDCSKLYCCGNSNCRHLFEHSGEGKPKECPVCSWCDKSIPQPIKKWYTSPGAKVGQIALNYDAAITYNYCVVVEGPMDVFRIGSPLRSDLPGPAICIFNHVLSTGHMNLLSRWRDTGPVFLCFDDDVWDKTHKQATQITQYFKYGVIPVVLPSGKDPGDLEHKAVWECIKNSAKEYGLAVDI